MSLQVKSGPLQRKRHVCFSLGAAGGGNEDHRVPQEAQREFAVVLNTVVAA